MNNHFKLFDLGKINKNKNLIILGRSDDVMHVRGHRIGSGEIETYIMQIREIKEVCAISSEDEIEGSRVVIFYSLN